MSPSRSSKSASTADPLKGAAAEGAPASADPLAAAAEEEVKPTYRTAIYACHNCDVQLAIGDSTHPGVGRPTITSISMHCPVCGHPMQFSEVACT